MIRGLTGRSLRSIAGLFLISRILILFAGYVGTNLFAAYTEPPVYIQQGPGVVPERAMKLPFDLSDTRWPNEKDFAKFDSFAYFDIAVHGYDRYRIEEPHPPANWVFFPLYPLVLRAAAALTGLFGLTSLTIVGSLLSNVFFFAALLYVFGICRQQNLDESQTRAVLVLMLLYPTSLFYSLPYTESLFLLLSAASLYYSSDKRYALAFIAAGLSTVTRVPGVMNLFFVAGMVLLNERFPLTKRHLRLASYGLLSLLPIGLYLLFMKIRTGDWLAPFHEQSSWYRQTALPFTNYAHYFQKPYFMAPGGWDNGLLAFVMSTAVILVYLGFLILRGKELIREPRQLLLWVYGALLIVIPFSSQPFYLASVVRYMMVCIPFYLYTVRLTTSRDNARFAYKMLFAVIHIITVIGFFNDYYFMA
ncbi:mannosyltransferase family protein [Paenibacillus hodogayensis]|uniref:Mannosyltransferase family protein n=1 Tax=Paenibacillus hodogayensis TaxID=279208 RepID=A0ABV5W877_9BACL